MARVIAQAYATITKLYEGIQVKLTNELAAIPCTSTGAPMANAYIGASTTVEVFMGASKLDSSQIKLGSLLTSNAVVASASGVTVSITGVSEATGYVDIPVSVVIDDKSKPVGTYRFNYVKQYQGNTGETGPVGPQGPEGSNGSDGVDGVSYTLNINGGTRGIAYAANGTKPEPASATDFSIELFKNGELVTSPSSISWVAGGNFTGSSVAATFKPVINSTYSEVSTFVRVSVKETSSSPAINQTVPIVCTKHADGLDWIEEWDKNYVEVGDNKIITPKIFAGTKDSSNRLTGVAMGREVISGNANEIIGLVGYKNNIPVFSVDQDANFLVSQSGSAGEVKDGDAKGIYFDGKELYITGKVKIQAGSTIGSSNKDINDVIAGAEAGSQAKEDLDNFEVGGRNLLRDTRFISLNPLYYSVRTTAGYTISCDSSAVYNGNNSLKIVKNPGVTGADVAVKNTLGDLKEETLILSFYAKSLVSSTTLEARWGYTTATSENRVVLGTDWKKYVIKIPTSDASKHAQFYMILDKDTTCWISNFKLEKGKVATDWTPAPEDLDSTVGNTVKTVDLEYGLSSSTTTAPTSWSTNAPTWVSGKYMWSRTKTSFVDGSKAPIYSNVTCISGATGQTGTNGTNGTNGKGIKSTSVTYQASSSGTTTPTGSWSTSIPSVSANQYLWTRTIITYTDNATSTSYSIGKMGATGAAGSNGTNGAPGQGISSITEEYYLSTSKTTQAGSSWTTTAPTWSSGRYVWTRSKIVYTNPTSTAYTTPLCDSSWEAVNEIEVGGTNLVICKNLENGHEANGVLYPNSTVHKFMKTFTNINGAKNIVVQIWNPNKVKNTLNTNRIAFYNSSEAYIGNVSTIRPNGVEYESSIIAVPSGAAKMKIGLIWGETEYDSSIKFKVELGNKPTDWTLAPEDIQSGIDQAQSDAYGASSEAKNAQSVADAAKEKLNEITLEINGNTYIKGNLIADGTITGNSIMTGNFTIRNEEENRNTFVIGENGDVTIDGTLQSTIFSESRNLGYKITSDGNAIFNQAKINGEVLLPNAGITNYGATIGGENLLTNSSLGENTSGWNGAYYEQNHLEDGFKCTKINVALNRTSYLYKPVLQFLKPNTSYAASFWVKCKNIKKGATNPTLMLYSDGNYGNGSWFSYGSKEIDTSIEEWQRVIRVLNVDDTKIATATSYNLFAYFRDATGEVYIRDFKLEEGTEATPYSPSPNDDVDYTRIWAGSRYELRNSAPFRVTQSGNVYANNVDLQGILHGTLDSGDVQIYGNAFTVHAPNSETEVIRFAHGQNFINSNLVLGSSNDRRVEFLNSQRELNLTGTDVSIDGIGLTSLKFDAKGSGGIYNGLNLIANQGGGHHVLRHSSSGENAGTMIFDSEGNQGLVGDFRFIRKNLSERVKVRVDGALVVEDSITSTKQGIEMRSISGEGWGFYAT